MKKSFKQTRKGNEMPIVNN